MGKFLYRNYFYQNRCVFWRMMVIVLVLSWFCREQQIGAQLEKNHQHKNVVKTPLMDVIHGIIVNQRPVIQFRREATDRFKQMANGNQRLCNVKSWKIQQMRPHNNNAKQKQPHQRVQRKLPLLQFTTMTIQMIQEMVSFYFFFFFIIWYLFSFLSVLFCINLFRLVDLVIIMMLFRWCDYFIKNK